MTLLLAHGIGGISLPVPTWLFFWGAAVVLFVSFVALGVLWRRPLLERDDWGKPLPEWLQSFLLSRALRIALGSVSLGLLVIVTVAAALLGDESPSRNLAPTFVYIVFWLGLLPVVPVLGDVWPVLNPWKAAADAVAWLVERLGVQAGSGAAYPERLGRWPAAILLFLWAALELAYWNPAAPRSLGLAIVIYSALTWMGAAVFGREIWFRSGEAFTSYFGFLARMAPLFAAREREGRKEIVVRPPLVGLAFRHVRPGSIAFVAVMLGSVAFDGFSRTIWWQDRRASLAAVSIDHFALTGTLLNVAGLVVAIAAVALAYLGAVELSRRRSGAAGDHADLYLGSLIPIAAAYAVSHYFTLLLIQGQFAITLASDPLGRGWDLFGTADFQPEASHLSPPTRSGTSRWPRWRPRRGTRAAHDRAAQRDVVSRARRRGQQIPMLALMVLYTVGGLWLLAQN